MERFELTLVEKEVLGLLTEELLRPKQITLRRKTSPQATYKIIRKLKKKGAYTKGLIKVEKEGGSIKPLNQIRIHAQQFLIKIIWKDIKYKTKLKKSNQVQIDGNTIDMYENSIYISSNQSFYGDNLSHAFFKSGNYWPRFFARLEHETGCILFKPRSQNIKLTRVHIAETDNELAKMVDNKGDRFFKVYASDDGKLRFLIDNSFNLHEFEGVRAKTARPDMEKVGDVFNDIADKKHYLPSDTKIMLDKMVSASSNLLQYAASTNKNIENMTSKLNFMAVNQESHAGLIKEAKNMLKGLNKRLNQRSLKGWLD